jgi:cell wall-associated NlpC family hydrolase
MADTAVSELPLLTPPSGGVSIAMSGLEPADVIVSTTGAIVSKLIRLGTLSPVSHAILYVGDGMVVEAIGDGVVHRTLEEALSDANLAVAYRCPVLSREGKHKIATWALQQAKKKLKYSHGKIAILANPKMRHLCGLVSALRTEFICSEFVIEAYRQADCPITTQPAACVSPQGVLEIARQRLVYVGHLRGDLLKRSQADADRQSHLGRYGE